jgi:hypothetical protein
MSCPVAERAVDVNRISKESYLWCEPDQPDLPYAGGEYLRYVMARWIEANRHYELPVSRRRQDPAKRFYELASWWKGDVRYLSSLTEMAIHPAYQQIIGMGKDALPFLLRELDRSPDHWFWALKAITGADPVAPEQKGRIREMAAGWLRWAKEQGLEW